jgi:hypothetical protein
MGIRRSGEDDSGPMKTWQPDRWEVDSQRDPKLRSRGPNSDSAVNQAIPRCHTHSRRGIV